MIASGFSKDPIGKLQNWHAGAVRQRQDESVKAKEALFSDTVEKFEQAFEKISSLDGINAGLQVDHDSKPGEVNVFGVGSLKKTADGFILETFKMLPTFSPIGAGLQLGSSFTPSNMEREKFTVDTNNRTIRHEVQQDKVFSPSLLDSGPKLYPQGLLPYSNGYSNYTTSTVRDVTINTNDKTVDAKVLPFELGWLTAD